jgi:hypothetical protein
VNLEDKYLILQKYMRETPFKFKIGDKVSSLNEDPLIGYVISIVIDFDSDCLTRETKFKHTYHVLIHFPDSGNAYICAGPENTLKLYVEEDKL